MNPLKLFGFLFMIGFLGVAQNSSIDEQTYLLYENRVEFLDQNREVIGSYYHKKDSLVAGNFYVANGKMTKDGQSLAEVKGRKLNSKGNNLLYKAKFLSSKRAVVVNDETGENILEIEKSTEPISNRLVVDKVSNMPIQDQDVVEVWLMYQAGKWLVNKKENKETSILGVAAGVAAAIAVAFSS